MAELTYGGLFAGYGGLFAGYGRAMSPKGVYPHTHIKPREYPPEIAAAVRRMYEDEGRTVREVQAALPPGYKAQRIIERHVPQRRPAVKRDQRGPKNSSWRDDEAGYTAVHLRLQSERGRATEHPCVDCGGQAAEWSYQGGSAQERTDAESGCAYVTDLAFYAPRCRRCHTAHDRQRQDNGRFAPRGGDANVL